MTFTSVGCCECGIQFGIPEDLYRGRKADKKLFYCPNGHSLSYRESEADKLRRERDRLQQQLAFKDDQIKAANDMAERLRREKSAAVGQVTKLKRRASAGVCPCCHRTFSQMARHMATVHPTFRAEAAE